MSQKTFLTVRQKKFDLLKIELGWNGDGTQLNPIIVNNLSNLPPIIRIVKLTNHIVFKDLEINSIDISNCRNITIQGCEIRSLGLHSCQDVVVRNNTIHMFRITHSGNNLITKNKMSRNDLFKAKERSFEKMMERIMLFAVIILIFSMSSLIFNETFMEDTPWMLYFLLIFVALIISVYIYLVFIRIRSSKLPPNQFEENIIMDERDLLNQYFDKRFNE